MSARVEQPVDLELLSAYVDGQVTEQERAFVRAQLAVNPAWQRELDTLLWTVNLLQATPDMPLPRSFEIPVAAVTTPTVVSTTPRADTGRGIVAATPWWRDLSWLHGFLRLSSAASVALLVIVFGVEVLTQSQLAFSNSSQALNAPRAAEAPRAAAPPQALQQQVESAPKAAAPSEQPQPKVGVTEAPKIVAAAPPAPQAQLAPKAAAPTQAPAQAAAPAQAPAMQNPQVAPTLFPQGAEAGRAQSGGGSGAIGQGAGGQGAGGGGGGSDSQSGGAGVTTDKGAPIVQPQATTAPQAQPPLDTQPLSQRKESDPIAPLVQQASGSEAANPAASAIQPYDAGTPPLNPLRTLQIALGVLAVVLGVGAWVVGRRLKTKD